MDWRIAALIVSGLVVDPSPSGAAFELDDAEAALPVAMGFGGNPAALAGLKCRRWSTDHYVPFALGQLASTRLTVATGLSRKVGVGLGMRSTGFSLHRETSAWLGTGYAIGHSLELGFALAVQEWRQPNARARRVGFTPGIRTRFGPGVELDLWYQKRGGEAPSKLFLSIRRRLDSVSFVSARWRYTTATRARLEATAEQHLHPRMRLLVGVRTRPRRFAGGALLMIGRNYLSVATITHPYLGPSPAIGMGNTCRAP